MHITLTDTQAIGVVAVGGVFVVGSIANAVLSTYQQVAIKYLKVQAAIHDAAIANLSVPSVTVNVAPVEAKLPVDH